MAGLSDSRLTLSADDLPSGVMTFCMSDVEGSTRLWEAHPEAMAAALIRHDALIAAVVKDHGGHLVKSMGEGDSTTSVFDRGLPELCGCLRTSSTCTFGFTSQVRYWSTISRKAVSGSTNLSPSHPSEVSGWVLKMTPGSAGGT